MIAPGKEAEEITAAVTTAAARVPESIQQMIEHQLEQLSAEEQRVLEVASVAGVEFAVAAVAADLEAEVAAVEECCAGLARRQLFLGTGEDQFRDERRRAARYRFQHVLVQHVLCMGG